MTGPQVCTVAPKVTSEHTRQPLNAEEVSTPSLSLNQLRFKERDDASKTSPASINARVVSSTVGVAVEIKVQATSPRTETEPQTEPQTESQSQQCCKCSNTQANTQASTQTPAPSSGPAHIQYVPAQPQPQARRPGPEPQRVRVHAIYLGDPEDKIFFIGFTFLTSYSGFALAERLQKSPVQMTKITFFFAAYAWIQYYLILDRRLNRTPMIFMIICMTIFVAWVRKEVDRITASYRTAAGWGPAPVGPLGV
ncbi:hypothetical protein TWF481_003160 [Arthrobotrys musiformis]|uniref:Uncharacterized protein n=1 Tax=Arthrobotrys musiformis TaxID=47236 RepID=A0AAV9VPE9_9PEZI